MSSPYLRIIQKSTSCFWNQPAGLFSGDAFHQDHLKTPTRLHCKLDQWQNAIF